MRVGIAQIDTTAGALRENAEKIIAWVQKAKQKKCQLVVFPEMALTGYPVCDLAYERDFLEEGKRTLRTIAARAEGIYVVLGFIDFDPKRRGEDGSIQKFNSAALLGKSRLLGTQAKALLPTYDVFDERRFFTPASEHTVFEVNGLKIGLTVCEDLWDENYSRQPINALIGKGARLIVNVSASPFHVGKFVERKRVLQRHSLKGVPIIYANKVGVQDNGQDILVFDGQSMALNSAGKIIAVGKQFSEELITIDLELEPAPAVQLKEPRHDKTREMLEALVFGLRGYAAKCGFSRAVVGLSGGIDSSVVACIAAKAFGSKNVLGVSMPSMFSSKASVEDSKAVAKNLGIEFKEWPIQRLVETHAEQYKELFGTKLKGTAAENPQARLRGNALMTISNAQRRILLGTGNKTELALGYCTLYGDMAGGIEVIGDISKLNVYRLARYINKVMGNPIPKRVIEKRPSAELAPNQTDPFDYQKISPLVDFIVEANKTKKELLKAGFPERAISRIKRLVGVAQYKRKQAPPVIRVTKKAFGSGRVYPIINKWVW